MLDTKSSVWVLLLLLLQQVTALVITRDPEQNVLLSTLVTTTGNSLPTPSAVHAPQITQITPSTIDEWPSVVTPTPESSRAAFVKRQPCCFNEQGFRVDCAQWTGYYYTWGPSGNPYEGGPQCDGNWNGGANGNGNGGGSGNGGGGNQNGGSSQVVVYEGSAAYWPHSSSYLALGCALLLLALAL